MNPTRLAPAFVPAALAASEIGTWESDVGRDRTIGDHATAAMFGLDHEAAACGLPLAAYTDAIHPDDVVCLCEKLHMVRERGGLVVVEYRVQPMRGMSRWVLARGRYERDPATGCVTGRDIVIDITESKFDVPSGSRGFFLAVDALDGAADSAPLDRAAGYAIAARRAIDQDTSGDRNALRDAVDRLLWTVGHALARRAKA